MSVAGFFLARRRCRGAGRGKATKLVRVREERCWPGSPAIGSRSLTTTFTAYRTQRFSAVCRRNGPAHLAGDATLRWNGMADLRRTVASFGELSAVRAGPASRGSPRFERTFGPRCRQDPLDDDAHRERPQHQTQTELGTPWSVSTAKVQRLLHPGSGLEPRPLPVRLAPLRHARGSKAF